MPNIEEILQRSEGEADSTSEKYMQKLRRFTVGIALIMAATIPASAHLNTENTLAKDDVSLNLEKFFSVLKHSDIFDGSFRIRYKRLKEGSELAFSRQVKSGTNHTATILLNRSKGEGKFTVAGPLESITTRPGPNSAIMATVSKWLLNSSVSSYYAEGSIMNVNNSEWYILLNTLPRKPDSGLAFRVKKQGNQYSIKQVPL